jgi:MFS family permease
LRLNVENEFNFSELKQSFKNLHFIFILSFIFFLGRFNDGVIMIFLKNKGFPEWFYLATISFFNIIMLLISPFMGYWVDKKKDYFIMFLTIISLFLFNLFYSNVSETSWVFAGFGLVCWGVQRAGAQITFSAMIFKRTSVKYYGTAIGVYSLLSGFGVFIASFISGYLAQTSFTYVFMLSGSFSLCALLLAFYMYKTDNQNNNYV